ncbi:TRAP transporter large permease [Paracoccus methylarcula]|uniref:TRAP transporter large permease protein n=1 Tax=Paracoccus methylarcula TaxID=72022 RepID=A0A3R7NXG3_9RHOB|nr:TRAP transporter large permease [Paracoccus methylarcula]RNF34360.1 TRAP transporter large permease [Paracoccus methylarcula]
MDLLTNPAVIGLFIFFALLALNFPVFTAIGLAGLAAFVVFEAGPLSVMPYVFSGSLDSFPLLATPLFIVAGNMITRTGIANKLVRVAELIVGPLPGGLALTVLVTGAVLASMSGSNIATVAALSFLVKPMAERGYPRAFAVACVAAGCTFGVVIPPSIGFIIYGVVTETSIPKLFAAGVGPGMVMLTILGGYVLYVSWRRGYAGATLEPRTMSNFIDAVKDAFWGLMAPVIILGGIYTGIFTATEAAAVAVVYLFIIDRLVYHSIRLRDLPDVLFDSGRTIGVIVLIIATSAVYGWVMQTQGLATRLNEAVLSASGGNTVLILLFFNVILLVVGAFLEPIAAMYLLVPLFKPTLEAIGFDLVHFGAVLTVNLSMAHLTPPVGVGLYLASQLGGVPFARAARYAIPFVILEFLIVLIVTYVKPIAMFLPSLM